MLIRNAAAMMFLVEECEPFSSEWFVFAFVWPGRHAMSPPAAPAQRAARRARVSWKVQCSMC